MIISKLYFYLAVLFGLFTREELKFFKPNDKHFVVVTASYNNAFWCEHNIRSVFNQEYDNWSMIYIDDCSTDGTGDIVELLVAESGMSDKVKIIHNNQRMGACYNQHHAIWSCPDDVIIVHLDGDDWFAHTRVLARLNEVYQDDIWITYGQFRYLKYGNLGCSRQIPHEIIKSNSIRQYPAWITSHLRTFYAGLYKQIKPEHLMYQGQYMPMAVDVATMFPMIEMAGRHSRFIDEVLYIYNNMNPQSFFHERAEKQREILTALRGYPVYEPLIAPPYSNSA